MNRQSQIFLVGYRGSGKTTVGSALAARLGWDFYDTDTLVVATAGCSIASIVEQEGWECFRQREAEVLQQCTEYKRAVIATGGGIILREENRRLLTQYGTTVFLSAPVEVLATRLLAVPEHAQRPPLRKGTGGGPSEPYLMPCDGAAETHCEHVVESLQYQEIKEILAERLALYNAVADRIVDASQDKDAIVAAILRAY